jgi:hypothetical protein
MNLSSLARLGKVAGIGGIAVGAVVLIFYALIGTIPGLPADRQAEIVTLLAYLGFGIGGIGIIAWSLGDALRSRHTPSITADRGGIAAGRDVHVRDVNTAPRNTLPRKIER